MNKIDLLLLGLMGMILCGKKNQAKMDRLLLNSMNSVKANENGGPFKYWFRGVGGSLG